MDFSFFGDFKKLVDMPVVFWTFVAVAVLFVVFLVLFILVACKKASLKKAYKTEKDAKEKLSGDCAESQKTVATLTEKVNSLTDELAQTKSALKEARLLRGAADSRYEDLKVKYESLSKELESAKAKLESGEPKKAKKLKKSKAKRPGRVKVFTKEELDALTKHELLTLAKSRKLSGFYHINKDELVKFILTEQEKSKK